MTTLLLLALGATVRAEGYSTDVELVRPTFSAGAIPGLDSPTLGRPGTIRVGTLLQYERDPLLLYQLEREAGAVISNRLMAHLGVSADLSNRFSARLVLPLGGQWGSEVEGLAADQGGMGDASLGARVHFFELGPLSTAGRLDVMLPFGTQGAYLGEKGLRGAGGLLAEAQLGPLALVADAGVIGRAPIVTEQDFSLGSELALSGGARLDIWPETVSLGAGVISRMGLPKSGDAERPVEVVADLGVRVLPDWRMNVGLGRGVAAGYGTTQIRAFAGLTWQRTPPLPVPEEPTPVARLMVTEAPDLPPEVFVEPPPEPPKWKADELARVEEKEIVIRDPIQFELATARILPESIPTLHAIAKLLAEHPEIGHLVIEGHASEEGSYAYNYDLSLRRALSIFQELILAGTYPGRLSVRGMGEVEPVTPGADEAALAKNRRVIFHIVRRIRPGEVPPPIRTEMLLPWDGAPKTFAPPPPIPVPEPERVEEERAPRPPPRPDQDFPTDPGIFEERDEEQGDDDDEEEEK